MVILQTKIYSYHYCEILKSYLISSHFIVKQKGEETSLFPINAEVPQGTVLGPILYFFYTADLPTTTLTTTATFADGATTLVTHVDPIMTSQHL